MARRLRPIMAGLLGVVAVATGAAVLPSCLEPNPNLLKCGDQWGAQVQGAKYRSDANGNWYTIAGTSVSSGCVAPTKLEAFTDPDSATYLALQDQAVAACVVKAGTSANTCAENVSDVYHEGKCLRGWCPDADFDGGDGGVGGAETGTETGGEDEMGFVDIDDGISCQADVCQVHDSVVSTVLDADFSTFMADGSFAFPAYDARGRQRGFEIGGVGAGNLGDLLGFENGDVVTQLDGVDVPTVDVLLNRANQLLDADEIAVTVQRAGRPRTLRFERVQP